MKSFFFISTCVLLLLACSSNEKAEEYTEMTPENHDSLMIAMMNPSDVSVQTIGILVYDGVNDLDTFGPRYVLGQIMGAKTMLVSTTPGPVTTVMGARIIPDAVIDSVSQLDILVVPGGYRGTILNTYDKRTHEWIRMIDENSVYTAGVCTGTWILGGAGLLEGKEATTNWYRAEEMMTKFGATFVDTRFHNDGKYWTSAGVTAGMDMSLAIMKELLGEDYTQGVMLDMEYDPAPPIVGGSPETTKPSVYNMMLGMYDMGIQPMLDSLEAINQ
ncbi:MAG: DJ-1/PfpI family protein [Bacteroidota bacterium]